MSNEFAVLLRQLVERYATNSKARITKQEIARLCGYSPSMFSHLLSGDRSVRSRDAVRAIARGLGLSIPMANELLVSAGFAPLSDGEEKVQLSEQQVFEDGIASSGASLEYPEGELLGAAVAQDLELLGNAWGHYLQMRRRLVRREWSLAADDFKEGLQEYYWPLRRSLSRFLAHLYLVSAAAAEHKDHLDDADGMCRQGLLSAEHAEDPVSNVMLLVRLADIEKLKGNFRDAQSHYKAAKERLENWEIKSSAKWEKASSTQRKWSEHWWARIMRKEGSLSLFMGRPHEADQALSKSSEYFEKNGPRYEQSRVCHSLGWAHSLLGDWDSALNYHQKGLKITEELNEERGWGDQRSLLQGYLYVGGDYLDRQEHAKAHEYLQQARELAESSKEWITFDEVGRIYLLLGKLFRDTDRFVEAERFIRKGIDFYERKRDPIRLASGHNICGVLYARRGEMTKAVEEYERAEAWAKTANPPNRHYEIAAQVNRFTAVLKGLEPPDEHVLGDIERVAEACRANSYWQHLARLKITEAEVRLKLGVDEGQRGRNREQAHAAVSDAFAAACRFNRFLVGEIYAKLNGLPVQGQERLALFETIYRDIKEKPGSAWQLAGHDRLLADKLDEVRAKLGEELGRARVSLAAPGT